MPGKGRASQHCEKCGKRRSFLIWTSKRGKKKEREPNRLRGKTVESARRLSRYGKLSLRNDEKTRQRKKNTPKERPVTSKGEDCLATKAVGAETDGVTGRIENTERRKETAQSEFMMQLHHGWVRRTSKSWG